MKKKIDLFNQVQGIKNIFDEIKSHVTLKTGEEQENFLKLYEKLTIWSDRLKDNKEIDYINEKLNKILYEYYGFSKYEISMIEGN